MGSLQLHPSLVNLLQALLPVLSVALSQEFKRQQKPGLETPSMNRPIGHTTLCCPPRERPPRPSGEVSIAPLRTSS